MSQLTRRTLMTGTAAAAVGASITGSAQAAAPMSGKQAPSFYRYKIGDLEITVISDGAFPIEVQPGMVTNASIDQIKTALATAYMPTDKYANQFNPVVVNTGAKLVLLDAGNASGRSPTTGLLPAGLAAAGF